MQQSAARSFRNAVAARRQIGTFVKLPGLEVLDIAVESGVDFVVLDLEHSTIDRSKTADQLGYARARGLPALVRLDVVDRGDVGRLLDAGAVGIMLAGVREIATVRDLLDALHFPPAGSRGLTVAHRVARYGAVPVATHIVAAAHPIGIAQIESNLADAEIDAILAEPLDGVFVGPLDLSVDLGVPGELDSPSVGAVIERVATLAAQQDRWFGLHATGVSVPAATQLLTTGTDLAALGRGWRAFVTDAGQ